MVKKVNDTLYVGKFITFEKTIYPLELNATQPYFWEVTNTDNGYRLGYIEWFKTWRKFSFFNYPDSSVFEEVCLRDIAEFLVDRTSDKKALDETSKL